MKRKTPHRDTRRRPIVSLMLALITAAAAALAGVSPAAAAPPTGNVDPSKWPDELKWALPNTDQFTARYMTKKANETSCSREDGGNAYGYVMDYLDHAGEIFQAISHSTGTPVLSMADVGGVRTDLPQLSTMRFTSDNGEQAIPYPIGGTGVPHHGYGAEAWCGKDFAQFGVTDLRAPFGFSYYSEPDAGSVRAISKLVDEGGKRYTKYWATRYEKGFDARNLDSYCAEGNPLCLTASFLHCDQNSGDTPDPELLNWCHTWNYDVAMYNALLMETVRFYGTKSFDAAGNPTGSLKTLDVASNAVRAKPDPLGAPTTDLAVIGHDAYLARWAAAMAIPEYISLLRGLGKALTVGTAVGLGVAAGIAAFWLGAGLLGSLLIGGAVAAFTVFSVDCGLSELAKCLAKMTAEGMSYTLASVPDAAAATKLPNMTSSIWKSTFSDIATVSVAMLLVLFIINLILSLVAGKPQLVFRSFLGVFGYFIALSAGGAVLSLLVAARNLATQKISGGPGFINDLTNTLIGAINKLGSDQTFTGWLLIAVLCLVSMISGFIVLCILYLSNAWVPLIIGILILQLAGWAAPGLSASKWFRRGTGILWSTLLMAPAIAFLWRVGMSSMTNTTEVATIAIGTATLLASAAVPGIVAGLFSLGTSGKLGLGAATLGAGLAAMGMGKAIAGLAGGGASMRPGKEPGEMTDDQLAYGSRMDGRGGGALSSIASKITPTTSSVDAAGAGNSRGDGAGSDAWAVAKDDAVGNRGKHSASDGKSKIAAVADSPGDAGSLVAAIGSEDSMVGADGVSDADSAMAGVAERGGPASGVIGLDKTSTSSPEGSGSAIGADAASDADIEMAGVAERGGPASDVIGLDKTSTSSPEGSGSAIGAGLAASAEGGSNRSETVGPSVGAAPPIGSAPNNDERPGSAGEHVGDLDGPAVQGGSVGGPPSNLPATHDTAAAGRPASGSSVPGSAPATGSGSIPAPRPASGGGPDRLGSRSMPSVTPPASAPSGATSGGSGSGSRPSAGLHGVGWNAPDGVPPGSISGSGGSRSSAGPIPAGWPAGVPWGVPLDEDTGRGSSQPGADAPVLPPWHAHDIPWGETPAAPGSSTRQDTDEDPRPDGEESS